MNVNQATYSAVLGVVLSNARKQQGVEQGEMAERMGLSQASYSRLEGGKSAFSVDQLYMAAGALKVNPEEVTSRLNNTIAELRSGGVEVLPLMRGNATGAKDNTAGVGPLVAGAALGALAFSLLSNK
jgi:transcriptional regulator with XRE-family HTH domain